MPFKGIVYFSDWTDESEEVFDTEEEAKDWCLYEISCSHLGGAILASNGEDAELEDPDWDIIEV